MAMLKHTETEASKKNNCARCGKLLPVNYKEEYCSNCQEDILFDQVRDYIRSYDVTEMEVAEHFGIAVEDIYTAGDGWNDLEMLKAYNGIAMSGTAQEIMDSAKWVYDSVGEAVYDLFLNK